MPEPENPESTPENTNATSATQTKTRMFGSVAFWTLAIGLLIIWAYGWYSGIGGRWVHLLLVIAILSVVADLLTRGGRGDLNPSDETAPEYSDDLFTALDNLRTYVIGEAVNTIDWYWKAKKSKARPSYVIRFLAWILAAFGGLLPIIGGLLLQSSNANPASQGILTKG